jgi:hypothetical protein
MKKNRNRCILMGSVEFQSGFFTNNINKTPVDDKSKIKFHYS